MMGIDRKTKEWQPHEDDYIKSTYPTQTHIEDMVAHLNRSKGAIYTRANVLEVKRPVRVQKLASNLKNKVTDTDWKVYYLRHNTNLNNREIGERLGLSKFQVMRKLSKNNLYYQSPPGEVPDWYKEGRIDF